MSAEGNCQPVSANWKKLKDELEKKKNESQSNDSPKGNGRKRKPVKSEKSNEDGDSGKEILTKALAIDCEFVGVGVGGKEHMLARVSIVNSRLECVYDTFVRPTMEVVDYRTPISGVRPKDIENAELYAVVRRKVATMLHNRILVGHSLKNDLEVLGLNHPKKQIRDTAKLKLFHKLSNSSRPKLKTLAFKILGIEIQNGEHNSVEDASAAMQLYANYRKEWNTKHSFAKKKKKRKKKHK